MAEAWRGKAANTLWLVGEEGGREGLARFDIDAGQVQHAPVESGQEVSEPIFVSAEGASSEAQGYALMLTYDRDSHRSFVGVYDGADVGRGPLAKVWFGHHIPTTFHGAWVPA